METAVVTGWFWVLYADTSIGRVEGAGQGRRGGEGLTDGEELVDLAVVPQVRLVELAGCLHDVEDQAQLGEHPPHGLVDPGAARQRGHGLVEAHVLGSDPDP